MSSKYIFPKGRLDTMRKIKTPEELVEKVQAFFDERSGAEFLLDPNGYPVKDKNDNPMVKHRYPTTAGLALHLGFTSRQSIYDYMTRYSDHKDADLRALAYILKQALLVMKDRAEEMLLDPSVVNKTGLIFYLKNANSGQWLDKHEHEHSGGVVMQMPAIEHIVTDNNGNESITELEFNIGDDPDDAEVIDADYEEID